MSYFKGLKLTRQGEQLLAKVNGNIGEILTFTRGELGSGRIDSEDEVYYLTALKNKWGELAITEITRTGEDETQVRIETQFTNAEWTEEKILREIGIYAKGKESSEILFAYSNAGENYDKIPIPQDNPQSFLIGITFKISTATKVDATISFSGFVTIEKLEEELAKKEDKISTKNTAFNKNFGVLEGEVLEGHRLAQALGLEFAGELNNSSLKQAGKAYWDNVNKSIYKCLINTTSNYADASYFEALSNHDLLLKLQNLNIISYVNIDNGSSNAPGFFSLSFTRVGGKVFVNGLLYPDSSPSKTFTNKIPVGLKPIKSTTLTFWTLNTENVNVSAGQIFFNVDLSLTIATPLLSQNKPALVSGFYEI